MRRQVGRILTVTSAVLFVATLAAWARAQFATHGITWAASVDAGAQGTPSTFLQLYACRGSLVSFLRTGAFLAPDEMPGFSSDVFPQIGAAIPHDMAAELRRNGGFDVDTSEPVSFDVDALKNGPQDRAAAWWGFGVGRYEYAASAAGTVILSQQVRGKMYLLSRSKIQIVMIPWWFLAAAFAAAFAVAPLRAAWRWRRSRRRLRHQCVGCRYDLRATADPAGPLLATCPECGRASGSP